ncbi:MAG: MBL fold metallo-hydrolase [Myxococcales bacterium]|nr:MBL fold metallo-hydrolase [Myxococcales bacterium]
MRRFVLASLVAFAPLGCAALFGAPAKVAHPAVVVRKDARLAVTWVGHATALVQMDDKVFLTDPVFTNTVGMVVRRSVEPGLTPEELPRLDFALVSHLHPDHLSYGSLDLVEKKVGHLLMPWGGLAYLPSYSFDASELMPWQSWERGGVRVTAVPVQHTGFRFGADFEWMREGYTGYVVQYHGLTVYFGGDTAYDDHFSRTRERFPTIDVALVPIGPIEPHDFMRTWHVDPAEAVQGFVDLGAKAMVPVHYDTFFNGRDAVGEAPRQLREAVLRHGVDPERVAVLKVGEQRVFVKKE